MKKDLLNNSWLLPGLVVAAAVAYFAMVFLPGQRKLREMAEELETNREAVVRSQMTAPAILVTQQEIAKARQYTSNWEEVTPRGSRLAALFGRINALAKASGVVTTRFVPQDPVVLAKVRRVPVTIGCTGAYSQVSQFAQNLESLPSTIWIDDFRLERAGKDGELVQCELHLAIFADNSEDSDKAKSSDHPI
jgi:Tfp pilus assembly protein PilO